jgi:hypothetical protein
MPPAPPNQPPQETLRLRVRLREAAIVVEAGLWVAGATVCFDTPRASSTLSQSPRESGWSSDRALGGVGDFLAARWEGSEQYMIHVTPGSCSPTT